MAPRKPLATTPSIPKQPTNARVEKPKRRSGPVRRFENGLLDVDRKAGKHVRAIAHKAQTPLLRLPGELRNKIWEYALGGHRFHGRKPYKRTPDTQPKNYFALQQVCRQIYAETTLLPFKLNEFYFVSEDSFDWWRENSILSKDDISMLSNARQLKVKLNIVRREAITDVRIATSGAERMASYNRLDFDGYEIFPNAFPVDIFPGLKRVVVEVNQLQPMWYPQGDNIERVEKAKTRLVEHIREHHKEVEIIFKGV